MELDGESRLVPIPIADALARRPGSYAIVVASIVQSTAEPPRLCSRCGPCEPGSPRAFGIDPVSVDKPAVHAESGTMLVRREQDGLAVIATSRYDRCTGLLDTAVGDR